MGDIQSPAAVLEVCTTEATESYAKPGPSDNPQYSLRQSVGVTCLSWTTCDLEFSLVALEDFWADVGTTVGPLELIKASSPWKEGALKPLSRAEAMSSWQSPSSWVLREHPLLSSSSTEPSEGDVSNLVRAVSTPLR